MFYSRRLRLKYRLYSKSLGLVFCWFFLCLPFKKGNKPFDIIENICRNITFRLPGFKLLKRILTNTLAFNDIVLHWTIGVADVVVVVVNVATLLKFYLFWISLKEKKNKNISSLNMCRTLRLASLCHVVNNACNNAKNLSNTKV